MKYTLKGLLQFKGVFHIIKVPFNTVGMGSAMTPWLTDEIINKITDEMIIKTQSLVTVGKSDDKNNDIFLIDVSPNEFNEAYRQNCVDILYDLVRKHMSLGEFVNSSSYEAPVMAQKNNEPYEFFNPNTPLNLIKAKFSNENYENVTRVNAFITYLKKIAADISNKSQVLYCVKKDNFSVYSLNSDWVSELGAEEVQSGKFFTEFSKDLLGKEHSLGEYFFNLDASNKMWEQMALRNGLITGEGDPDADAKFYQTLKMNVASAVLGRYIDIQFSDEIRLKLRNNFFGFKGRVFYESINCNPIMNLCLYKNYDYGKNSQSFLQYKDLIIKELSNDYFENIEYSGFNIFNKEMFKTFFKENVKNSSDGALFLKSLLFNFISSLMFIKTEKAIEIFNFIKRDVLPFFDLSFNRSVAMEFSRIDCNDLNCSNFFGIKIVQSKYNDENIIKQMLKEISEKSNVKEIYVCKPENAENLELLFFNDFWDVELKKKLMADLKERLIT